MQRPPPNLGGWQNRRQAQQYPVTFSLCVRPDPQAPGAAQQALTGSRLKAPMLRRSETLRNRLGNQIRGAADGITLVT